MLHGMKKFHRKKYFSFFVCRIRGLVKAKALHEQVASMEKIAGQTKVNKEQVSQQVHQLKQRIDQLINDISVNSSESNFRFFDYLIFYRILI